MVEFSLSSLKETIRRLLDSLVSYITKNYVWTIFIVILVVWLLGKIVYAMYGPNNEHYENKDDKYICMLKSEIPTANCPECKCPSCDNGETKKYIRKSEILPDNRECKKETVFSNSFIKAFETDVSKIERQAKCLVRESPVALMGENTKTSSY